MPQLIDCLKVAVNEGQDYILDELQDVIAGLKQLDRHSSLRQIANHYLDALNGIEVWQIRLAECRDIARREVEMGKYVVLGFIRNIKSELMKLRLQMLWSRLDAAIQHKALTEHKARELGSELGRMLDLLNNCMSDVASLLADSIRGQGSDGLAV